MAKETKAWYQSKTKVGAVLVGVGSIATTIGAVLQGQVEFTAVVPSLLSQIGIVCGIFGLRDLPFVNK